MTAPAAPDDGTWLVFDEGGGVGAALAERLKAAGHAVVRALPGDGFGRLASDSYRLDPASASDHEALLDELFAVGRAPRRIVHLWSLDTRATRGARAFDAAQQKGLHSLISLARALRVHPAREPIDLTLVGRGLNAVHDGDVVVPEATPLLGAATVVGQEFFDLRCAVIDLAADGTEDAAVTGDRIAREVTAARRASLVALRGRHRWLASFENARTPAVPETESLLRRGGGYVITGGLGGVGTALAERLARQWDAKVVLLGRTVRRPEWLEQIQAGGANVFFVQADVADEESLKGALERAAGLLGKIDGVVHAAGVLGGDSFGEIDRLERGAFDTQFGPKVRGTYALARLLPRYEPRFCLLVSSISTVLGGIGYAAYAAANRFLDGFAEAHDGEGGMRWIAANWDAWKFEGDTGAWTELAMTAEEGAETIERTLHADAPTRVIISTGDLDARLDRWVRSAAPEPAQPSAAQPAIARHARPEMPSAFVAPADDEERGIAAIWEDLLGIEGIGANDDFLELGGNSLLAVQVASRLQNAFGVSVPIRTLFEAPTAAELAERIRTARWVAESRKGGRATEASDDREEVVF